ncbi:hypothetical protein V5799_014278 [Amblyomma americanum]|uniref:Peptidase A1 domain-containing protein n=1 Tax=Amblyomma americanum TaxID=6943 RepID=A0AAQ4E3I2_AMBAM
MDHFEPNTDGYRDVPFDGIFGLGQPELSFFEHLAKNNVIAKPWLGFYFSKSVGEHGEALFGGANEAHYKGALRFAEYEVNCRDIRRLPDVTFTIASRDFVLTPREYVVQVMIWYFADLILSDNESGRGVSSQHRMFFNAMEMGRVDINNA